MNPLIKNKVLEVRLCEPSLTLKEIADKVGVAKSTVSSAVASTKMSLDHQLAAKVADNFLHDFASIIEFWKLQITQLERLKEQAKDAESIINHERAVRKI